MSSPPPPPPSPPPLLLSLVALSFRLLNAGCSRAFFQPDEYWQNLEVAHRWVYGYGYQTWEWRSTTTASAATAPVGTDVGVKWGTALATWGDVVHTGGQGGIRSPLSVVGTAAVYAALRTLGWDEGTLLASRFGVTFLARGCLHAPPGPALIRPVV